MDKWLDIAAALFAFLAAGFWFVSGYGKLPPMGMYWDAAPPNDPFYMAIKFSAKMNRWAAGFERLVGIVHGDENIGLRADDFTR